MWCPTCRLRRHYALECAVSIDFRELDCRRVCATCRWWEAASWRVYYTPEGGPDWVRPASWPPPLWSRLKPYAAEFR